MTSKKSTPVRAQPWVLTASHARARLFTVSTPTGPLEEVEDMINAEARMHEADLATHTPGHLVGGRRGIDGHGHTGEHGQAPKKKLAGVFAKNICDRLDHARKLGAISQLYVIADPEFLGLLRQHMSSEIRGHIALEINKDFSSSASTAIRKALPSQL